MLRTVGELVSLTGFSVAVDLPNERGRSQDVWRDSLGRFDGDKPVSVARWSKDSDGGGMEKQSIVVMEVMAMMMMMMVV